MIGEGRVLEAFGLIGITGFVSSSWLISSTGSLLGAGVILWVEPPNDAAVAVLRAKLLIGNEEPLIFGFPLAWGSSDFFLKKPAIDVWFLELELDLVSEGVGVPRVLLEDLEEGAMILGRSSSYRNARWSRNKLNASRDQYIGILEFVIGIRFSVCQGQ